MTFEKVCHVGNSGRLFVDVFVKGAAGELLTPEGRCQSVETLVENVSLAIRRVSGQMAA